MQFLFGLLTAIVFFILLIFAVYVGYRLGQKKAKPPNVDDEEQRLNKQLHTDFLKMMNYSAEVAMERKKVTDK